MTGPVDVPIDDGYCFACGPENPVGMHLQFQPDPAGGVVARTQLAQEFQGWRNVVHGGIAMALLDEAMAHAAGAAGHRGVTASMSVRFRNPVPVGEEIVVHGRVGERRRNVLFIEADVRDAHGEVLLEGEGKFVSRGSVYAAEDRRNPTTKA